MFLFHNNTFISPSYNQFDVTKAIVDCKTKVKLLAGNNRGMSMVFDGSRCKSTYDELIGHFIYVSIEYKNCHNVDYF